MTDFIKRKNKLQSKGKIIFCLAFVFLTMYLSAQNSGSYKYVLSSERDSCGMRNWDAIEVDGYYYLITNVICRNSNLDRSSMLTIFDDRLNIVKNIELFGGSSKIYPFKLFYHNQFFYLTGLHSEIQHSKPFLMKFDKDFNVIQSPVIYTMDDTLEYDFHDVIMNSNNEFVYLLYQIVPPFEGRILVVDTHGVILQDIFFPDGYFKGSIAEAGTNYFVDNGRNNLWKFCRDSLSKFDSLPVKLDSIYINADNNWPEVTLLSTGNHLIRTYTIFTYRDACGQLHPPLESDRSIVFLDTNLQEINRLEFGMPCAADVDGYRNMSYRNVDSIYYAYISASFFSDIHKGTNVGIANFSQNGHLNFNLTLDILEDSLTKSIYGCEATSDGGVLVFGISELSVADMPNSFILKYHPQKNDLIVKEFSLEPSIQVYPNPAQSQVTVTNVQNATLRLYNTVGQEMFYTRNGKENAIINTDHLPNGVYILKIEKENTILTRKIQIIR